MPATTVKVSAKAVNFTSKASLSRGSKQGSNLARSASSEALEHGYQSTPTSSKHTSLRSSASSLPTKSPPNLLQTSRLQLLLESKKSVPVFVPRELSQASRATNAAIKTSNDWRDVYKAVLEESTLSASSAAFALYRLGCLFSFASRKRNEELVESGLIGDLLSFTLKRIDCLDAGSITLLLDGCARLRTRPSTLLFDKLSNAVAEHASAFSASQLPLILWAFQQLKYVPKKSTTMALDKAIPDLVHDMNPQGLSLVLAGFRSAQSQPNQQTLTLLEEVSLTKLALFKPSELASCLEALSAFGHRPSEKFLQALKLRTGQSQHSNIVTGKRHLRQSKVLALAPKSPSPAESQAHDSQKGQTFPLAAGVAKAKSELLSQVGAKLEELHMSLSAVPPVQKHRFS